MTNIKLLHVGLASLTIWLSTAQTALAGDCLSAIQRHKAFGKQEYCTNGLVSRKGRLYALLIGINQPSKDFTRLYKPVSEVEKLAKLFLVQQYVVKTLAQENATKDSILCWLDAMVARATEEDRVLVYFTGHASTLLELSSYLTPKVNETLRDRPDSEFYIIPYQNQAWGINELISVRDLTERINIGDRDLPIRQRVIIIDACFGGYFVNASPLTTHMFDNELPADGFYALTSLKGETYDGQYFPFIYDGLKGEADKPPKGNSDGKVGLCELSNYVDRKIYEKYGKKKGEQFYSRYILIGSGEISLTVRK
jgi:hypothetical protein